MSFKVECTVLQNSTAVPIPHPCLIVLGEAKEIYLVIEKKCLCKAEKGAIVFLFCCIFMCLISIIPQLHNILLAIRSVVLEQACSCWEALAIIHCKNLHIGK